MAFHSDDLETDTLVRQLSELTGETPEDAVRASLRERLRQEQVKRGQPTWDQAAIDAVVRRVAALPVLDDRTDDEILGYNEHGGWD